MVNASAENRAALQTVIPVLYFRELVRSYDKGQWDGRFRQGASFFRSTFLWDIVRFPVVRFLDWGGMIIASNCRPNSFCSPIIGGLSDSLGIPAALCF